jgi:spore maturation protein CgeB
MKIAILTILYKNSIERVYSSHQDLASTPYDEQKKILERSISLWTDGWFDALSEKGYEVFTVQVNAVTLQKKWAEENGVCADDARKIAIEQIKKFQPDVLWYDHYDIELLREIKSSISSIKLVLGWSGSAIIDYNIFKEANAVLSCAPEVVDLLNRNGIKSYHLDHAFNPRILNLLRPSEKQYNFTFIGQVIRGASFHKRREEYLVKLVKNTDLNIFSSASRYGAGTILFSLAKKAGYFVILPFSSVPSMKRKFEINPYTKELLRYKEMSVFPYNRSLKGNLKPEVYGVDMLQTLQESRVVLNIHADSSSRYASNMRLFETTGIGSCLLSDWKENISSFFKEGSEIVTYKNIDECIEKAKWLIANPSDAERIGLEGKKRTMLDHTFTVRVSRLEEIINKELHQ